MGTEPIEKTKTLTIILNRGPYGSEQAELALNLALAARKKGYTVNLYLYIDGVWAPHLEQGVPSDINIEEHLNKALDLGVNVKACKRCADARGAREKYVIDRIPLVGLFDLVEWMEESEKVVSFS